MMPATGDLAPLRKLVAVRAIAPVTGIPPNKGATKFAAPCATSSAFELWRSPLMESATTADKRLSTAARIATVRHEGSGGRRTSARNLGISTTGSPAVIPPNLEPIVATGIPQIITALVANT